MSRRSNAVRALENARRTEATAYLRLLEIPTRTRADVATAPVVGDSFTDTDGRTHRVITVRVNGDYCWVWLDTRGAAMGDEMGRYWFEKAVRAAASVYAVESPARIARRLVWERAAARRETARATLDALPPAGHKRRKDGTCYPVQSPRQNAAAKAGRLAWQRAVGRSIAFMGVALAFVVLFLSACN